MKLSLFSIKKAEKKDFISNQFLKNQNPFLKGLNFIKLISFFFINKIYSQCVKSLIYFMLGHVGSQSYLKFRRL